jgi:hypothetical protein
MESYPYHKKTYESDGSVCKWVSHDGVSWKMVEQVYPKKGKDNGSIYSSHDC